MNYIEKWKGAITNTYSPKAWSFVSFILPLILVPIGVELLKKGIKEIKKRSR